MDVAVVGAGPAGLMAAETLAAAGMRVTVLDRLARPARRLLMAGRGGLNLTNDSALPDFLAAYPELPPALLQAITAFPPEALRDWADGLGADSFIGSSGRVFPRAMKASPLLRAWLGRLAEQGVVLAARHRWRGWTGSGELLFDDRPALPAPRATVLALGGGTWPGLGADPGWPACLADSGVGVAPFVPVNCGVNLAWSPVFATRFAGVPLKGVRLSWRDRQARGDAVVTGYGLEGGAIYALGPALPEALARSHEMLTADLRPDLAEGALAARLARAPARDTLSNRLRKAAGLAPVAVNLLREAGPPPDDPVGLARRIKAMPLCLTGSQGLARAISSAGGVLWPEVDDRLMLRRRPGVFLAGEMLDWSAPTGGYLLQACFATGRAAALGALDWLHAEEAKSSGRDSAGRLQPGQDSEDAGRP